MFAVWTAERRHRVEGWIRHKNAGGWENGKALPAVRRAPTHATKLQPQFAATNSTENWKPKVEQAHGKAYIKCVKEICYAWQGPVPENWQKMAGPTLCI